MVWPNQGMPVLVISLAFLLLYPAVARADVPDSYITETVDSVFLPGGVVSGINRLGYVEVEVPNNQDVLQYIQLEVSSTTNTDLVNTIAYKGVAASPNYGDRTRLYVNTTSSESNISYSIDPSVAPTIFVDMDFSNQAGGEDLFSGGTNYLSFNFTVNCTHPVSDVDFNIRFARNTFGINDSVSVYGEAADNGTIARLDSDGDSFFDRVLWEGDLGPGENDVSFSFMAATTPDINFNENFMSVDLDTGTSSEATYSGGSSTFSGLSFANRFSRGPVREGIELFTMGNWMARGFIRNMATGLDYRVNSWDLYQVGNSSPLDSGIVNRYPFLPGETEYTDWYDTGSLGSDEPQGYFQAAWDWEVGWGSSFYSSSSSGTIILPVLYEIDLWADKSVIVDSNTESGVILSVQDLARHVGHANLEAGQVSISSVIPRMSAGGETNTWAPSGITVLYINGSGQHDITSQAAVSSQAAGAVDGFVNVQISNLSDALGRGLNQNEDIRLEYSLSGTPHGSDQTYQFCQSSTLTTVSGTPETENICRDVVVPAAGVTPPPQEPGGGSGGPTGGGPTVTTYFADIVRKAGEGYLIADNLVDVRASYEITDSGDKGIKDVRGVIYIPEYGMLDLSSLKIRIFDQTSGTWTDWQRDVHYSLTDNGMVPIGEARYREYVIRKLGVGGIFEDELNLFNQDEVEISFQSTVPTGTSFIITRLYGYNYYEDKIIFEDMYVPVRREGILQDLVIEEGEWQMEKVKVGNPVRWFKGISVNNPNNVTVEHLLSFDVFPDTLAANLVVEGREGKEALLLKERSSTYVDIIFSLPGGEGKNYVLEVTTPPVLETGRKVEVLESSDQEIVFLVNATLESFSKEDYPEVWMDFMAKPDKVISVREGDRDLNFSGSGEGIEIFLGEMKEGWKRTVSIEYREIPPIIVSSMNSFIFGCSGEADLNILLIPAERETSAYMEVEVIGPEPDPRTVNAQLVELFDIYPWEEVEIPISLEVSSYPDGRYFVHSNYKKNFQTVLSDQVDFKVNCPERTIISLSWVVFAIGSGIVVAYIVLRARRKKKDELGIESLKKKLKDLR